VTSKIKTKWDEQLTTFREKGLGVKRPQRLAKRELCSLSLPWCVEK